MSVVSNRVSKIDLGQGLVASDSWMPTVFKSVRNSPPGSIATWAFSRPAHHVTQDHPVYIPRDLSPISAQDEADGFPTVAFQRGKSRESGLFGSSLFPDFVLGAARRSCCTLLLHKVRCSNSCLGGVR